MSSILHNFLLKSALQSFPLFSIPAANTLTKEADKNISLPFKSFEA